MIGCTILIASGIVFATPVAPLPRSVQGVDHVINLSNRVQDKTICPEIDRITAPDKNEFAAATPEYKAQLLDIARLRAERTALAYTTHCKTRAVAEGMSFAQMGCNLR